MTLPGNVKKVMKEATKPSWDKKEALNLEEHVCPLKSRHIFNIKFVYKSYWNLVAKYQNVNKFIYKNK